MRTTRETVCKGPREEARSWRTIEMWAWVGKLAVRLRGGPIASVLLSMRVIAEPSDTVIAQCHGENPRVDDFRDHFTIPVRVSQCNVYSLLNLSAKLRAFRRARRGTLYERQEWSYGRVTGSNLPCETKVEPDVRFFEVKLKPVCRDRWSERWSFVNTRYETVYVARIAEDAFAACAIRRQACRDDELIPVWWIPVPLVRFADSGEPSENGQTRR